MRLANCVVHVNNDITAVTTTFLEVEADASLIMYKCTCIPEEAVRSSRDRMVQWSLAMFEDTGSYSPKIVVLSRGHIDRVHLAIPSIYRDQVFPLHLRQVRRQVCNFASPTSPRPGPSSMLDSDAYP